MTGGRIRSAPVSTTPALYAAGEDKRHDKTSTAEQTLAEPNPLAATEPEGMRSNEMHTDGETSEEEEMATEKKKDHVWPSARRAKLCKSF
jgi:hypothetical protein